MKNVFYILLSVSLVGLLGCSRTVGERTTLKFRLPTAQISSNTSIVAAQAATSWNDALDPTRLSEINCYAVFVGGPEAEMNHSSCSAEHGTTKQEMMRFGPNVGFIPAGGEVAIDVPAGDDRTIYLVGLQAQNGGCSSFVDGNLDFANLSFPHILAEKKINLFPGEIVVAMTPALDSTKKFNKCDMFNVGDGGNDNDVSQPLASMFGDGRDGDFSIAVNSNLTLGTHGYADAANIGFTMVGTSVSNPSSKTFSSQFKVMNINSTGDTVQLAAASTADHFEAGDEVFWHVVAGYNTGGGPDSDNTCGGRLYRGSHGFSKISSVSNGGMDISLDAPIGDPSFAVSYNNTAISDADNFSGSANTWCKIQMMRVPNFNKINVTGGTLTIDVNAFDFSGGSEVGGVIVMRIKELNLAGGDIIFDASSKGFEGILGQGTGFQGLGTTSNSANNSSGGGASALGAGGGGNANLGGTGSGGNPVAVGGIAIDYCNNGPCLIMTDQKAVMGGAGGSDGGFSGGSGGGIIILHIGRITGTGSVSIKALGGDVISGVSGGGAGGSVHLTLLEKDAGTPSINVDVSGGGGGTSTDFGGGGSGGVAEISYCGNSLASADFVVDTFYGLAGGGAATDGGLGYMQDAAHTSICDEALVVQ
ncbi:MAG: hypothetical protein HOO06_05530 [Bdellovibrionaceae bacterium]|jgi:hypothetical protein|nr:hypothetical protein [Pseudobdellovibrionaceae bacterium]